MTESSFDIDFKFRGTIKCETNLNVSQKISHVRNKLRTSKAAKYVHDLSDLEYDEENKLFTASFDFPQVLADLCRLESEIKTLKSEKKGIIETYEKRILDQEASFKAKMEASEKEINQLKQELREELDRNEGVYDIYNEEYAKMQSKFRNIESKTNQLTQKLADLLITTTSKVRPFPKINTKETKVEKRNIKKALENRFANIENIHVEVEELLSDVSRDKENQVQVQKVGEKTEISESPEPQNFAPEVASLEDKNKVPESHQDSVKFDNDYKVLCMKMDRYIEKNENLRSELDETKFELDGIKLELHNAEKEARILKKSLHLSYDRYASLTSRRLLDLLASCVYDQHETSVEEAQNKKLACLTLKSSFEDHNHKVINYNCLNHFLKCSLQLQSSICEEFKDLLAANFHLNTFVHNNDELDEVIISGKVNSMNTCATVLNKVITYLKQHSPDDELINKLPLKVLKMSETAKMYKSFKCYQLAAEDYE